MGAVITLNNVASRDNVAPAPALHDDGSNYEWRMFYDDNHLIVDADTMEDCIEVLIPGYVGLSSVEKLRARVRLTRNVQIMGRSQVLYKVDPKIVKDWEWEVLNYGSAENFDPYGWGNGEGTLGVNRPNKTDWWESPYPLVLVDESYKPFTEVNAPVSSEGDFSNVANIIWLRTSTESEFLESLSRIGFVAFGHPFVATARKN